MFSAEQATSLRDFRDVVVRGDNKAIRSRDADNILMYDFADTVNGIADYDRTCDFLVR